MDYGQKGQSKDTDPAFFTAGVGNIPAEQNTFEAENNLDLTNQADTWAPERNHQTIGSRAMNLSRQSESHITREELEERFRDVIDLAPPPTPAPEVEGAAQPVTTTFSVTDIRTEGDHINSAAIREVDSTLLKLSQTGNISDFYATIRGDDNHPGMVRANLKNSFNREVK